MILKLENWFKQPRWDHTWPPFTYVREPDARKNSDVIDRIVIYGDSECVLGIAVGVRKDYGTSLNAQLKEAGFSKKDAVFSPISGPGCDDCPGYGYDSPFTAETAGKYIKFFEIVRDNEEICSDVYNDILKTVGIKTEDIEKIHIEKIREFVKQDNFNAAIALAKWSQEQKYYNVIFELADQLHKADSPSYDKSKLLDLYVSIPECNPNYAAAQNKILTAANSSLKLKLDVVEKELDVAKKELAVTKEELAVTKEEMSRFKEERSTRSYSPRFSMT